MPTWVALLRAINVGGRNKVPMPALRTALEASGFSEIRTYVQSGNVVADSPHRRREEVAEEIHSLVRQEFGVDTPVVVRRGDDLERVVSSNPFPAAAAQRPRLLHVVFLAAAPQVDRATALEQHELTAEVCRLEGEHLYVDYRDGVHGSKLTPDLLARLVGVGGTARNWQTVLALMELANGQ
jgi:uncharacterized protein (DUF1697 family)